MRDYRSKNPKQKICKQCEAKFKPYTSLDKFCSAQCRINSHKSKRKWNWKNTDSIKGKNNPAYRNGNHVFGSTKRNVTVRKFVNNSKQMKQEMIDSLGYIKCTHCNTSNSARFETHHIIYRSEKPGHKNLHDQINLIVLCIGCHNEFHKHKSMRSQLVIDRGLDFIFGQDIILHAL